MKNFLVENKNIIKLNKHRKLEKRKILLSHEFPWMWQNYISEQFRWWFIIVQTFLDAWTSKIFFIFNKTIRILFINAENWELQSTAENTSKIRMNGGRFNEIVFVSNWIQWSITALFV